MKKLSLLLTSALPRAAAQRASAGPRRCPPLLGEGNQPHAWQAVGPQLRRSAVFRRLPDEGRLAGAHRDTGHQPRVGTCGGVRDNAEPVNVFLIRQALYSR